MMSDDTLAILQSIERHSDRLSTRIDDVHSRVNDLHTRINDVQSEIHALDLRVQHIDDITDMAAVTNAADAPDGADALTSVIAFAAAHPRVFIAIVIALISGYPVADVIKDSMVQSANEIRSTIDR